VHVHGRVVRREVERAEVIPLALRLRAERDGEAQLAEDRPDLVDDVGHRMHATRPRAPRGHGEVERGPRRTGCRELQLTLVGQLLQRGLHPVHRGARVAALGRVERGQLLHQVREAAALASQEGGARRGDRVGRLRLRERGQAVALHGSDEVEELCEGHGHCQKVPVGSDATDGTDARRGQERRAAARAIME